MKKLEERDYHYIFAHRFLRDIFFDRPLLFFQRLEITGKSFLENAMKQVANQCKENDIIDTVSLDFEFINAIEKSKFAIITLPDPIAITEAKYIATLRLPNMSNEEDREFIHKYYTLELTSDSDYLLCRWSEDNNHINTMKTTDSPTKENFIKMILENIEFEKKIESKKKQK